MNNARLKQLEDAQTGIVRKTLSVTPINEAWPIKAIVSEMARCGSTPDFKVITSCLNSLRDTGLVKEPNRGFFQRVALKDETPEPPQKKEPTLSIVNKSIPVADPLGRMGEIAGDLRSEAKRLNAMAATVEECALAFQSQTEAAAADGGELKKLKSVLQGILKS